MVDLSDYDERLNVREQIARIDNRLADTHKKQLESHLQPWQIAITVFGSGAALLAAGAALLKLAGG